ncbi:MAG: GyrI-like domain-containing protein, partial [Methanococcaceae archaeon]
TEWKWQLMIRQPAFVTDQHLREAIGQTEKKKDLPFLKKIRLERFSEGSVVQIMHIGPYAEEEPNIKKLQDFMEQNGFEFNGRHHEIYLSDPRKTSPQKLKTILRHPFLRKD